MAKQIYFFQTEKDFQEFLKVIYASNARLFSYEGEEYSGHKFDEFRQTHFQISNIVLNAHNIPLTHYEKRSVISNWDNNLIGYIVPQQKGKIMITGFITLVNDAYKEFRQEYAALYKKLVSYIKSNYKTSKDKRCVFYAGADFYAEYQKGNLQATDTDVGSKVMIEF